MRGVPDDLLYIYNHGNSVGDDTKVSYQPPDVDALRHLCPRREPELHCMQIHLRLKMKLGSGKGYRSPMANAMCHH